MAKNMIINKKICSESVVTVILNLIMFLYFLENRFIITSGHKP